jgi:hypothetical protein
MSTWRGKALEFLPELMERLLAAKDRLSLWREVEREFHAAVQRSDEATATGCLRYAAWTLHPPPQPRTVSDVSESAARFLYAHADDLHRWIDRLDFMVAQKGLRFHLGDQKHSEFEAAFLEKTARYPSRKKANQTVRRKIGSRFALPPKESRRSVARPDSAWLDCVAT